MKSIKKTLCVILTMILLCSAITPVMANNNISVKINGQQIAFDVPPQLINGRTMVPLRAIFEALGAKVFYAAVSQEEDGIHLSGSRALGIVAQGETIADAEKIAEEACGLVKGNVYHRRDVGTADLIQKRIDHMEAIRNE